MSRFDLSKFKSPPDEELMCGICRNVLDDPKESPCRHVFCRTCIHRALKEKSKCPICRSPFRDRHLKDVLPLVQNMLNKLPMECDYFENGCNQPIPMERYLDHVKDCDYMMVTCKNESCDQQILKRDCKQHETEDCKYRTYVCNKGCQCSVIFAEKKEHNCLATLLKEKKNLTEKTKELEKKVEDLESVVKSHESRKQEYKFNLDNDEDSRGRDDSLLDSDLGSPIRSPFSFHSNDYNDLDSLSEPFSITPSISLSLMSNLSDCTDDYRDDDDLWGSDDDDGNTEEVNEELNAGSGNGPPVMGDENRFFPLENILSSTRNDNGDGAASNFPPSALNYQDIPSSSTGATGNSSSSRKRTVPSGASVVAAVKRMRQTESASETGNTAVRRSARLRHIPPSPVSVIECVPVPPPSSYLLDIYANENNSSSDDSWSPSQDQRF